MASFGALAVLAVPFGTATHLFAEVAGLGESSPGVLFSPHHAYLLVLVAAALLIIAAAGGLTSPAAERRRRIARVVAALPNRGTGLRFVLCSVALQLAFFAATQIAEGSPIESGNAVLAIAGALLASVVCALAINLFNARVLRAMAAAVDWIVPHKAHVPLSATTATPLVLHAQRRILTRDILNRPPPAFSAITP